MTPHRDCRSYAGMEYGNGRFLCSVWDDGEKLTPVSACEGCASYDPVREDADSLARCSACPGPSECVC